MALEVDSAALSKPEIVSSLMAASSSDEDEPVQIKRTNKMRINFSDDEEDENLESSQKVELVNDGKVTEQGSSEESNDEVIISTSKNMKKQSRILIHKDSDESADEDDPEERSASRSFEHESDDHGAQQRKILENMRSENGYDAESSENEAPTSGRFSRASNQSEDEEVGSVKPGKQKSKFKGPARKSKAACQAAMQKERMKMISESQRMVRESRASLPYHKPRQRSLKEFLSARPKPNPLLRGAKFQQVDLCIIGQELEEREKLAEEFYKPESDKEEAEECLTPPMTLSEPLPNEDRVLKVLLNTREELEKNIQANTISTLKCSSGDKEAFDETTTPKDDAVVEESKDISEIMELETPAPNEVIPVVDAKEKLSDIGTEVESMETETPENNVTTGESDTVSKETVVPESATSTLSSTETSSQCSMLSNAETEPVEKTTPPVLSKLNLAAEVGDACLTPSDAVKESDIFLKPAAKTPVDEQNKAIEEFDSAEDFHLYFEDSEDTNKSMTLNNDDKPTSEVTPEIVKSPEKEKEPENPDLDLKMLYNSSNILDSDDEDTPQPKNKELKGKAKILANLKLSSGPIRLKGGPNEVIDLDDDEEPKSGVQNLMQRFIRQATTGKRKTPIENKGGLLNMIKSGEQLEDTPDHNVKPGQKMILLKSELRDAIAKQRDEEFKKRQREYQMYEDETEGLLGDDGDDCKMLSDEEENELEQTGADIEEEEEGSTESEPELEDDVVLKDDPKPHSEFMDDEAEESEAEGNDEEEGEEMEEKPAALEDEEDEEEGEETEDSSEEEDEDYDKTETAPSGGKRSFQRIQVVEDSDEENDKKEETKAEETADTQPLEEEDKVDNKSFNSSFNKSFNLSMLETSGNDLEKYSGNRGNLCGITQPERCINVTSMPQGITQLIQETNLELSTTNKEEKKARGFPKGLSDLFQSTESLPGNIEEICSTQPNLPSYPRSLNKLIQSTDSIPEDIGALCSGQFITQIDKTPGISKEINNLIGGSETQGVDFADLCSGQFITQANPPTEINKLINNTQTQPDNLADLCSGQFVTQKDIPKDLDKLVNGSDTQFDNLADMCSGQFFTQIKTQTDISKELNKLVNVTNTVPDNLEDLCSGQFVTQASLNLTQAGDVISSLTEVTESAVESKVVAKSEATLVMRIVSDDEDDELDFDKKRLKKQKRKRKLEFSDEEDEGEEEDANSIINSEAEEVEDEGGFVDYDSEENEIIVSAPQPKIKPKHFFENEAELSESEWGSADEDEKGLDELEEELGDKEDIDENELKEALGKIHARRMLDEDKQDVRLFQEAFLEDGDLHSEGGGRQRQYRWKNNDDGTWAAGANPNLSGDEGGDEDDEEESTWRTARLERETWLQENKDKIGDDVVAEDNSQLLMLGRSLLAKMGNNKIKNGNNNSKLAPVAKKVDQSPGKVIRQSLQRKSGSFLARRSISMTQVVAMTGGEGEGGTIKRTTSKGNFVFCTVSPSSVKVAGVPDVMEVEPNNQSPAPTKKRPKTSNPGAKGPATKKKRVSSSVFQLLQ